MEIEIPNNGVNSNIHCRIPLFQMVPYSGNYDEEDLRRKGWKFNGICKRHISKYEIFMEKLENSESVTTDHNFILWKTANFLKFCDFEQLRSLFSFEINHLM